VLSPPPPTDYDYVAEHVELPALITPSHSKIRLDGNVFSIDYTTAYAAAWQHLAGRANELAIPLLYTQRHSFELILKGVLRTLLGVRYQMQLGHDIFGWPLAAKLNDQRDWNKDWERSHREHKFGVLFEVIDKNRDLLDLPPLPADFHAARAFFDELDPDGDGARFRYPVVWDKQIEARVSSFPRHIGLAEEKPRIAQLKDLCVVLARLASEYCRAPDETDDVHGEVRFHQALVEMGNAAHCEFANNMRALEKATEAGQLRWARARTPPLNVEKHPDFTDPERVGRLCPEYVALDCEGRRLVIVMIGDDVETYGGGKAGRENAFLLTRQRIEDGTLGDLIMPQAYQSNLINRAMTSAGVIEPASKD
jgi:hypothetical protein